MAKIWPIIEIIQQWMKQLGYPEGSDKWINPYHSTMSNWDKSHIAAAFKVSGDENTEYTILMVANAYGIGIDNLDIKVII